MANKRYDLAVIGTGSGMAVVEGFLRRRPNAHVAVIDKDEPGGICLTKGCIPSKVLLYPAEVAVVVKEARSFGIDATIQAIDFGHIMRRMRDHIQPEIDSIRRALSTSDDLDYYPETAEFTGPRSLKVGDTTIDAEHIILSTGSRPRIPPIEGIDAAGYLTSDTLLQLTRLPETLSIIGGGYIAAEYGHFFSAMGSKVTIIGRNTQFLPDEEPEISAMAKRALQQRMTILTGLEVRSAQTESDGKRTLLAIESTTGREVRITSDEVLIAAGRASNSDLLHPERAGIEVDANAWIKVNEYLETSRRGIWALGDADGIEMYRHKANYQANVLYQNAVLGRRVKADYHAVPHAVFSQPEVAGVGLGERQAIASRGRDEVLIGFCPYEDTAKGFAMGADGAFAKVIIEAETMKILGAHIVGPQASVLIQEVVTLMYTRDGSGRPLVEAMHIHPALNEVVARACYSFTSAHHYQHVLSHYIERLEARGDRGASADAVNVALQQET